MSIKSEEGKLELSNLKSPVKVGAWQLKNRLVMASLTRSRAVPVDVPNAVNVDYYRQRAEGGAGLILSEGTLVSPQGAEWPNVASIYSDKHTAGWRKVTDAVHEAGGLIVAQLWHVGRVAHPDMPLQGGKPVSAPSAISARGGDFRLLMAAGYVAPEREHPDPQELVNEFRDAAQRAKEAGFDGVEFHGANGYLGQQFLDKNSNHRTDKWGGSLENRARFYVEVLSELTKIWGADRVGIKLNPCAGYNDLGMNEEDTKETYNYVIKHCVSIGLAYVQLVRYLSFMDGVIPETGKQRAETHLDVFGTFGPLFKDSKTSIFINGNIGAKEGDELIGNKTGDAVVLGRSFINNPDLPKRLFNGLPLNEDMGRPLEPKWFYSFLTRPQENYSDYPTYEEAKKKQDEEGKKKNE